MGKGPNHWVQVLSFGQLVLERGQLLAQGGVQTKPPPEARNPLADHGMVQTASQLAQLSQSQAPGSPPQPQGGVMAPIALTIHPMDPAADCLVKPHLSK